MRKMSPSGVGHPYNMCRHLVCVGVFSEIERRDIWWVE